MLVGVGLLELVAAETTASDKLAPTMLNVRFSKSTIRPAAKTEKQPADVPYEPKHNGWRPLN